MPTPALLLDRLDAIGRSLRDSGHGLALLALGSVGIEQARLDNYSDLDFFAIVETGYKQAFLADVGWLESVHPVAYAFKNTDDGYKLLYADGIFCEYAIFEPQELAVIPYAEGRWVWHAEGFDTSLSRSRLPTPTHRSRDTDWILGEALTNIYVGLMRFHRGEKLIAQRFIQHLAVDRVIELAPRILTETPFFPDVYTPERRIETRYPALAAHLPAFVQGYEGSPASALAILTFLEAHFEINAGIAAAIRELLA